MGAKEWIISLALGFVALPLGALIRLIPNGPCERVFVRVRILPKPEEEPTFPPDVESGSAFAVDRVRGSSFVGKRRSAAPDPDGDGPHLV
jgi:Ca2+-transporting ATPase